MIIREEIPNDIGAIRRLVLAAFGQAAEAGLVESLRASGDVVTSLVADEDGDIVGHVLFSKLQAPEGCLGLAPVSVLPGRQNQGIGSKLIQAGLARVKDDGWQAVFLLGEPAYYERFGFLVTQADRFETIYPKPYVMALELAPGALAARTGALIYAAPFIDLE
jgi:putative acetyltransferase